MSQKFITEPNFFEEMINSKVYTIIIEQFTVRWVYFQQDGAKVHSSTAMMKMLLNIIEIFWG